MELESSAHAVAGAAFNTIFSAWARGVVDPLLSAVTTLNLPDIQKIFGLTQVVGDEFGFVAPLPLPQNLNHINTRTVRGKTRTKRADISWWLAEAPNGRSNKWPIFVGEAASSECRTKLQEDVDSWTDDSENSVDVALAISVLRSWLY
ncbi:unnamed protein product [Penicillium bialowiezense]